MTRLVVVASAAVLLVACTGDDVPGSLPFAEDPAGDSAEVGEITSEDEAPTSTLFDSESFDDEPGPTTTQVPPPEPVEPTLVVECATNPRTITLTFANEPAVPLDWELTVVRQSGIDRATVVEPLAAGTEVPEEPIVHEVVTNDLGFSVSASNASGSVATDVDVDGYSGCPEAGSLQGRVVEQIDCVSGAFQFTPALGSGVVVDSVVVDRVSGSDSTLPVTASGVYQVPGWSGPEEVKAIVTFTDSSGIHTEHINHWCFGGPFGPDLGGDYKVCADDAVILAYPREWVSALDVDGEDCAYFRYRSNDGSTDNNVTLESLGAITLEEAKAALLPPGPWIVADEEAVDQNGFSDRLGTTAGGERIRFELAWDSAPSLIRRVVWLVEVDGIVWRLGANIQGLEEIDGMANSLQFLLR